jgi:hypothetical protein
MAPDCEYTPEENDSHSEDRDIFRGGRIGES